MSKKDFKKWRQIVEGQFIPSVPHTLIIDKSSYELLRSLMKVIEPENYSDGNKAEDSAIVMNLYPGEHERITSLFKKYGIPFEEHEGYYNPQDDELRQEDNNITSPYAGNDGTPAYIKNGFE